LPKEKINFPRNIGKDIAKTLLHTFLSSLNSLRRMINTLFCTEEPTEQPDIPHYDSLSEIKLGHLFAEEIITFLTDFI